MSRFQSSHKRWQEVDLPSCHFILWRCLVFMSVQSAFNDWWKNVFFEEMNCCYQHHHHCYPHVCIFSASYSIGPCSEVDYSL